jgi:hypothetical protein
MTKPTFPALVALLVIWAIGAIALTAIYILSRVASGQADRPVISAETIAPIFGEVEPTDSPKVHQTRKPKRLTPASMLAAEAIT